MNDVLGLTVISICVCDLLNNVFAVVHTVTVIATQVNLAYVVSWI